MAFKVKSDENNRKIFLQVKDLENRTERSIRQSFYKIGTQLMKEARRSIIQGPKTGRVYRIKGRKRRHRASAPGEPPANLFGNLQKSVNFEVRGSKEMIFGAGNDSDVKYARILELGGNTKFATIQPRPYLIRAINEKEKQTDVIFNGNLKRDLNRL
jgi:hypothetical protein